MKSGVLTTMEISALWTFILSAQRQNEPNPNEPKYILTVRGVGYKFNGEVRKE